MLLPLHSLCDFSLWFQCVIFFCSFIRSLPFYCANFFSCLVSPVVLLCCGPFCLCFASWWTSFAHCSLSRCVLVLMFLRFCAFFLARSLFFFLYKWNVSIFIDDFIIIDLSIFFFVSLALALCATICLFLCHLWLFCWLKLFGVCVCVCVWSLCSHLIW